MSNKLMPKDKSEELKVALLKQLDSALFSDNNAICWGAEGTVGLTVIEKNVDDTELADTVCTSLSVKFYINKLGQVIHTTIK